ncbi:hypothetical protein K445DRAFT_28887, partial [Daldinia sp. EC12]
DAKSYNKVFTSLTEESACASGQVACVNGNIGKCSSAGAFEITPCADTLTCYALPMTTVRGVQIGCWDDATARKALGGDVPPAESAPPS